MLTARRLIVTSVASVALLVGLSATAVADASSATFGQHVTMGAQMDLGQRANPPAVTCVDNGAVMTFPNFGAMVQHMRAMDG